MTIDFRAEVDKRKDALMDDLITRSVMIHKLMQSIHLVLDL